MGLYLPLCKSGLSPLKSADVKIWVNKGGSRPGAVIPALLLLFRLGFQICNWNIIFPVIWECGLRLSWNKRMNRCRLPLQSCSMVPRKAVVAGFQLHCHSEWSLSALLQNSLFCYSMPLSGSSNNAIVDHTVVEDFTTSLYIVALLNQNCLNSDGFLAHIFPISPLCNICVPHL